MGTHILYSHACGYVDLCTGTLPSTHRALRSEFRHQWYWVCRLYPSGECVYILIGRPSLRSRPQVCEPMTVLHSVGFKFHKRALGAAWRGHRALAKGEGSRSTPFSSPQHLQRLSLGVPLMGLSASSHQIADSTVRRTTPVPTSFPM